MFLCICIGVGIWVIYLKKKQKRNEQINMVNTQQNNTNKGEIEMHRIQSITDSSKILEGQNTSQNVTEIEDNIDDDIFITPLGNVLIETPMYIVNEENNVDNNSATVTQMETQKLLIMKSNHKRNRKKRMMMIDCMIMT